MPALNKKSLHVMIIVRPLSVADPEGGPWVPWNPPFKENVLCSIIGLLANYLLI